MKPVRSRVVTLLTLAAVIFPSAPLNAGESQAVRVSDVTLQPTGMMVGSVVTAAARPVSRVTVEVLYGSDVIATTQTSEDGQFAVSGLRNGTHVIRCSGTQMPVRLWSTAAAPPSSVSRVAVVVNDLNPVVRGQQMPGGNLLIPLGIGAGALAVTLATTLGQDDPLPLPPVSP